MGSSSRAKGRAKAKTKAGPKTAPVTRRSGSTAHADNDEHEQEQEGNEEPDENAAINDLALRVNRAGMRFAVSWTVRQSTQKNFFVYWKARNTNQGGPRQWSTIQRRTLNQMRAKARMINQS